MSNRKVCPAESVPVPPSPTNTEIKNVLLDALRITAEKWTRGEATIEQVGATAAAAYFAATPAVCTASSRTQVLAEIAEIVREYITLDDIATAIGLEP